MVIAIHHPKAFILSATIFPYCFFKSAQETSSTFTNMFERISINSLVSKLCPSCKNTIFVKESEQKLYCCPQCGHHFTMPAAARIAATSSNSQRRASR